MSYCNDFCGYKSYGEEYCNGCYKIICKEEEINILEQIEDDEEFEKDLEVLNSND